MADDTLATAPALPWRARAWPILVVALLAGHALLLVFVVLIATRDRGFAVEPGHYDKALHWDDIAAQRATNQRLGWRVELGLGDRVTPVGDRELSCTLVNSDGRPLDGAAVEVVMFPHARGTERTVLALAPRGAGGYAATTRFPRKGLWEFRFTIKRGPETFTKTMTRDVYPPGESRPWAP
jgi:nitrogen fixation protein FixH